MIVKLNRLQRKVLLVILAIVVVPMLAAAVLASEWVATTASEWITAASEWAASPFASTAITTPTCINHPAGE